MNFHQQLPLHNDNISVTAVGIFGVFQSECYFGKVLFRLTSYYLRACLKPPRVSELHYLTK